MATIEEAGKSYSYGSAVSTLPYNGTHKLWLDHKISVLSPIFQELLRIPSEAILVS